MGLPEGGAYGIRPLEAQPRPAGGIRQGLARCRAPVIRPLRVAEEVSQGYVDNVIAGVEEQGPYIVITPRVAIPHARSECGAHGEAIGITTLDGPVAFGSTDNDPVRYLFP